MGSWSGGGGAGAEGTVKVTQFPSPPRAERSHPGAPGLLQGCSRAGAAPPPGGGFPLTPDPDLPGRAEPFPVALSLRPRVRRHSNV